MGQPMLLAKALQGAIDPTTHRAVGLLQGVDSLQGSGGVPGGGVLRTAGGHGLDPDGTSSRWNRLVKASGLPRIRLHDARHTHATLWLKSGEPAHVVSQRLGHSSVGFTLSQYGHVLPGQQAEGAARVAALVDG